MGYISSFEFIFDHGKSGFQSYWRTILTYLASTQHLFIIFYILTENEFTHSQQPFGQGLWDDHHGQSTKNLPGVGVCMLQGYSVHACFCILNFGRVSSIQLLSTSFHFGKLLSVSQKISFTCSEHLSHSQNTQEQPELTIGSQFRLSQKILFSYKN